MRSASLESSPQLHQQLECIPARPTSTQALVFRACCVLMVAYARSIRAASRELACQPATVRKWCRRVKASGLPGLQDASRPGRPRRITTAERCAVVAAACQAPSDYGHAGHTRWSANLLARALVGCGRIASISARSVQRILQLAALRPHSLRILEAQHRIRLRRQGPPHPRSLSSSASRWTCRLRRRRDQHSGPQRRFPDLLPRHPGERLCREAEYIRHGTRCLTAAFFVHTGRVLGMVTARRRKEVFIAFLDLLHAEVPADQSSTLWIDNLNTHRGAHIEAWIAARPGRLRSNFGYAQSDDAVSPAPASAMLTSCAAPCSPSSEPTTASRLTLTAGLTPAIFWRRRWITKLVSGMA